MRGGRWAAEVIKFELQILAFRPSSAGREAESNLWSTIVVGILALFAHRNNALDCSNAYDPSP